MSVYNNGIAVKPSVVLIDKWIASNEFGQDDSENVSRVVDNEEMGEADKGLMSHNDERSVNGENSLSKTLDVVYDDDDKTMSDGQQSIDEPASAASVLFENNEKPKPSKSKRKSKKNDRQSRRSSTASSVCICTEGKYLKISPVSLVALVIYNSCHSYNVSHSTVAYPGENAARDRANATSSSSNGLKMDHTLYEEMVVEVELENFPTDEMEHDRPIRINTNYGDNDRDGSHHRCDRAISECFDGQSPMANGVQTNSTNYLDANDYVYRNGHRSNSKDAEYREDEHQTQNQSTEIQFVDDDEPIDYSMRYHHQHNATDSSAYVRNRSTVRLTEESPAAQLRTGFAVNGFLPYPTRFYSDDQRSNLYYPAAQAQIPTPWISQHSNRSVPDLAGATNNGFAEHTPGNTTGETMDVSTQTDVGSKVDSWDKHGYGLLMANHDLILKIVIQLSNTIVAISQQGHLNNMSPGQVQNVTSTSENHSNQQLENVRYDKVDANSKEASAANIPNGRSKKNIKKKKGIPQKRSQRILEMEARKKNELQKTNETEAVAPKKSKSNVAQPFEVENESDSAAEPDDNWLDAAPRKIILSKKFVRVSIETPIRPSKYVRGRMM